MSTIDARDIDQPAAIIMTSGREPFHAAAAGDVGQQLERMLMAEFDWLMRSPGASLLPSSQQQQDETGRWAVTPLKVVGVVKTRYRLVGRIGPSEALLRGDD